MWSIISKIRTSHVGYAKILETVHYVGVVWITDNWKRLKSSWNKIQKKKIKAWVLKTHPYLIGKRWENL